MNFTKTNKRKTAMLLHQLEESLGNFVIDQSPSSENLPSKTVNEILARSNTDSLTIEELIASTYILEIFHFILEITKDNSMYKHVKELEKMFIDYDISTIRNAISHPNRPFIDEYWYKTATIASSKVIDILGLDGVKEALISAESNQIVDPPNEWLEEITKSIILNNLPLSFEHSITELIGRPNEEKELLKSLQNRRIPTTAIVAAGGIGKTALVLDILGKLSYKPDTATWCDAIIFIDMKIEKLTIKGISRLEGLETIDEVKKNILLEVNKLFNDTLESIEEVYKKYSDKKLLIFIDNLETLIRDNHTEFEDFNYSLPETWRLLVTSRLAISSAKTIPLENLKKKSAIALARKYMQSKGDATLDSKQFESIVNSCHSNPLAIKLTIDLYISGQELPSSIAQSSTMVGEFSYTSLIEKLSDESVEILEALFLQPNIDRSELHSILGLSLDKVAIGIQELSKTSLIVRKANSDLELFSLSSSIKELLLVNPRNIEIRNRISVKLSKDKDILTDITRRQEKNGIDTYNEFYIPSHIHKRLQIIIKTLNSSFNRHKFDISNARNLLKKFDELKEVCKNEEVYYRSLARLHKGLGNYKEATLLLNKALELNSKDVVNKFLLADIYFRQEKEYEQSEKIYYEIIETKGSLSNRKFATKILNGYFLSLLYQHKYEEVLLKTKNWEEKENLMVKSILGTYRASAWRRKLESVSTEKEYCTTLDSSINAFSKLFEAVGYPKNACIQVGRLIDEIEYNVDKEKYPQTDRLKWIKFIYTHNNEILKVIPNNNNELIKKLSKINLKGNPFINQKIIYNFENTINKNTLDKNYQIVKVSTVNDKKGRVSNYLFAQDEYKKDYIIHFSTLKEQCWNDWEKIQVDVLLAIKVDKTTLKDKNTRSVETFILE